MKCQRMEKWISDSLDGELSDRKKKRLEGHLRECSSCRSYKRNMMKIHELSQRMSLPQKSPSHWEEFSSRLKKRLSALEPKRKPFSFFPARPRWAYLAAGAAVLLFAAGTFFLTQKLTHKTVVEEAYIFSFEEAMAELSFEIGDDVELINLLNFLIQEDIGALVEETESLYDDNLFLESLTEEESVFLESEIKKEIKS